MSRSKYVLVSLTPADSSPEQLGIWIGKLDPAESRCVDESPVGGFARPLD
jgi:hypothetical protein